MIYISNKNLLVGIKKTGAELQSIKTVSDNHEYMWQGDVKTWERQAPILFPHIGAINNDTYTYKNKEYTLTQHGFARDMEYNILEQSDTKVIFSVNETEETLKVYPFNFQLVLGYELKNNDLIISYKVINKSRNKMLFSIGAHPGFNCPLEKNLSFNDYKLTFNKPENSKRRYKDGYVLSGETEKFFTGNSDIMLSHDIFKRGALIFDDLKSTQIVLESSKGNKKVKMDFTGFPYMGIWTWPSEPAPFICLEPWYGIDSTLGDTPELEKKEGLITLEDGEVFNSFYTVTIE